MFITVHLDAPWQSNHSKQWEKDVLESYSTFPLGALCITVTVLFFIFAVATKGILVSFHVSW